MKRLSFIAFFLVLLLVVGGYLSGRGRHRLERPPTFTSSASAESYEYDDAAPTHSSDWVWPAINGFLTDVPTGARILDLGSGSGALLNSFQHRGWDRVGIDISTSGVEAARRAYPDVRFIVADATEDLRPLLGENTFDVVVSTETLEHVHLPRAFLANAHAVLKPGGRIVLSVPYNGYLKHLAVAVLGRGDAYFDPLWDWGHIKFYSTDTLAQLLWNAGFTDVEWEGTGRVPYFWKSMVMSARKP